MLMCCISNLLLAVSSGVAMGRRVWEQLPPPHFLQGGTRDLLKIDEKIRVGKGVVANLRKIRGGVQKLSFMPPLFLDPV